MRIVTWNVNGIRAAIRKGLDDFIERIDADIWLLQEVRALPEQLPTDWSLPDRHEVIWHPAERKGYSGVATMSRVGLEEIGRGIATKLDPEDAEGRVLTTNCGPLTCINIYLPNGGSGPERQAYKDEWLEDLLPWSKQFLDSAEPVVLVGDLNIAHTEDDIWNPSGNRTTSGFLDHEREWFSRFLAIGWYDLHRIHYGSRKGPYTWWSFRGRARAEDRGWRIDYVLANAAARPLFKSAEVIREGGLGVSDHAPLIIDLDL
ncbi:MAG: exodeoxyribonuclease III [Candidatus Thalassarchaeaceae archaeon]|nr:exodeoxyribonuclease III [Candidatus Thalassarchaeaceae archaeon]MDP6703434.1 exodeoxyribonuclease III [Candidatus Thalassarchaeaceae archaeon]MDP7004399.1 exodeoxyribonuclease III [Candidatus Thalassarchaeaceae archaeon]